MSLKRLSYLDCAKGVAIILVILGHVEQGNNPLCNWIYSFHLPLFFIISGVLLAYKNDWISDKIIENVKKKAIQLIYPYMEFSGIALVYMCIYNLVSHNAYGNIKRPLLNTICFEGYSTLWFLPTLFIAEVFFMIIVNLKYTKAILCTLIFLGISGSYVLTSDILLSNYLFIRLVKIFLTIFIRSIIATSFINIGYLAFEYLNKIKKYINKSSALLICILLFFVNLFTSQLNQFVDLHYSIINNPILYYFNAICGSIPILILLKKKKCSNFVLDYCGRNSLIIMATHLPLPILEFTKKIYLLTNLSLGRYLDDLIILVIILLIEICIVKFINRYATFIIKPVNIKIRGILNVIRYSSDTNSEKH